MQFTPQFVSQVASGNFDKQLREGVLGIDNSEYVTWQSCLLQGIYYGGLKRVGARSRAPLAFGGAVHAGLDAFLKAYPNKTDFLGVALADAAVTGLDDLGDPKRNTSKLIDLLNSYTLEYSISKNMRFDTLNLDGVPCVEQSFSVPLGVVEIATARWGCKKVEILWQGKIDLLTQYDEAICPVDHKTTTVMGEKFIDDKVRSSQFLGYTYAARYLSETLFGGRPVFGARVNALAMRSSGFEFKLFDIPYPDWKVAEWQRETLLAIRDLIHRLDSFLQDGLVAPNREHCVTKYGKCQYFEVCDSPATMRDRIIFDDSYFFVSNWSPLGES